MLSQTPLPFRNAVLAFVGTATSYWMKFGSNHGLVMATQTSGVFTGVFSASSGWIDGTARNGNGLNNAAFYLGLWSWGTWGSNGVWTCVALPGSSAHAVRGFSAACDSIKAVQVFSILQIFFAFLTLIFSAITAFFKGITNFYGVLSPRYAGISTAVLGGLAGIIAMAIWLGEVNYTPVSQQFGATSEAINGVNSYAQNLNNQAYGYGLNGPAIVKDMTWNTNQDVLQNGTVTTGILGTTQPILPSDVGLTFNRLGKNATQRVAGASFTGQASALWPSTAPFTTGNIAGTAWAASQNQISGGGYTYNAVNSGVLLANTTVYPNLVPNNGQTLASYYDGTSTARAGSLYYGNLAGQASTSQPILGNSVSFALVTSAWVILVGAVPALLFLEEQSLWVPTISKSVV